MKKSTKIILITSGTVIFVSVVLIVVLALPIRAQAVRLPTPSEPYPIGNLCPPTGLMATISTTQGALFGQGPMGLISWDLSQDVKNCIRNAAEKNNISDIFKPFDQNKIRFLVKVYDLDRQILLINDEVAYGVRVYETKKMQYGKRYRVIVDLQYPNFSQSAYYTFGGIMIDIFSVAKPQDITPQPGGEGDVSECAPRDVHANIYRRDDGSKKGIDVWLHITTQPSTQACYTRCPRMRVQKPDGQFQDGNEVLIKNPTAGIYSVGTYTANGTLCYKVNLDINQNVLNEGTATTGTATIGNPTGPGTTGTATTGNPTGPGTTGSGSSDGCGCEAVPWYRGGPLNVSGTLKYIVCEIRCAMLHFAARVLSWSWHVMTYYSGLDSELPKLESTTSSGTGASGGSSGGSAIGGSASGGSAGEGSTADIRQQAIDLCNQKKTSYSSVDWEKGPCLDPNLNNSGYAVDVAHKPRQEVDNQNTCPNPTKRVELDTNCNIIEVKN